MTLEEKKNNMFSSEQLETVHNMIGEDEPSLFSVLQHLSKQYDEKTTIFLAKEFCLKCESDENQRVALEFLYMNGFRDEIIKVVKQNLDSENQVNREWGEVYNFILERRKNLRFEGELSGFAENYTTSDPTLSCLLIFLKVYSCIKNNDYVALRQNLADLTEKLLKVDNTLMRVYFQARENEVLFHFHWKRNELEIARHYADNFIQNTYYQLKRCEMILNVAITYMFEDYQKSMELLDNSRDIALDYDFYFYVEAIDQHTRPFVKNVNGVTDQPPTDDEAEYAHYLINIGENDKALKILNKFKDPSVFQEYYKALALDDEELLYKVYDKLISGSDDYFFAELPLRALNKKGGVYHEEKSNPIN
ncbi:AimR family lysis-lysogeny pheromone receptor [Pontibacillus salicampi]|uniref:AimR family lysis-lysogeny pheromone receptor n=1 Tax=Pontibacillus salicampi TaxID=1449801 RepID=A0ABV6LI80_9BACI